MSSLEVRQLSVAYGKVVVLQDIDLSVDAGSIVCILGANGAGKSSFLKCLVGLVPAKSGRITWEGEDITNLKPHEAATRGIALSPKAADFSPIFRSTRTSALAATTAAATRPSAATWKKC